VERGGGGAGGEASLGAGIAEISLGERKVLLDFRGMMMIAGL